jgi:hypothetical protein
MHENVVQARDEVGQFFLVAPTGPTAASAIRSLPGRNRTCRGRRRIDAIDPKRSLGVDAFEPESSDQDSDPVDQRGELIRIDQIIDHRYQGSQRKQPLAHGRQPLARSAALGAVARTPSSIGISTYPIVGREQRLFAAIDSNDNTAPPSGHSPRESKRRWSFAPIRRDERTRA